MGELYLFAVAQRKQLVFSFFFSLRLYFTDQPTTRKRSLATLSRLRRGTRITEAKFSSSATVTHFAQILPASSYVHRYVWMQHKALSLSSSPALCKFLVCECVLSARNGRLHFAILHVRSLPVEAASTDVLITEDLACYLEIYIRDGNQTFALNPDLISKKRTFSAFRLRSFKEKHDFFILFLVLCICRYPSSLATSPIYYPINV